MERKKADTAARCREILTTCAVNNLRKLTRLTTNRFNEKIKPTGLRHTQVCVLLAIGQNPGKPLSTYADDLGMDLSTLVRSVETLQKTSFVMLRAGLRRERLASLTPEGDAIIEKVYPLWLEAQNEFVRSFGRDHWQNYLTAVSDHRT